MDFYISNTLGCSIYCFFLQFFISQINDSLFFSSTYENILKIKFSIALIYDKISKEIIFLKKYLFSPFRSTWLTENTENIQHMFMVLILDLVILKYFSISMLYFVSSFYLPGKHISTRMSFQYINFNFFKSPLIFIRI